MRRIAALDGARLVAALVASLAAATMSGSARATPIIGDPAPALAPLDDRARARGVTVVDFFATWCEPCHEAMAILDEIARRRGVTLIVVDVGEPAERARAYFAAHPLPPGAELVLDERAEAARRFGARRFPTTFVLRDGVIRHINRGFGRGYAQRMEHWITSSMKGP